MNIFENLKDVSKDKNTVLTLGTFDGIHLGHQEIINKVIARSLEKGGRNFVITFHPHPRTVISADHKIKLLTDLDEKIEILEKLGVQNLLVIKFTQEFAELSAEEFVQSVLVEGIGVSEIVLGHNHHFGKGRGGNVEMLKKLGTEKDFSVIAVDDCKFGPEIVSSTKIRKALESADIETANKMLGRYYSFNGKVIEGDKRGRELGYPTANVKISDPDKLIPAIGIYAVKIKMNSGSYNGLLNIGQRPTFYESGELVSEVYIYDFDENIYGKKIKVEMIERIRGEEKFSTADELITQMDKDKENGIRIFNKLNN